MKNRTVILIGAFAIFFVANIFILAYALRSTTRDHKSTGQGEEVAQAEVTGLADAGPAADPAALAASMQIGEQQYATCLACHGPDGKGMKVGPTLMAPSLVGSKVALGDPDRAALVVLKGIKKETTDYTGIMAPLTLDDEALAGVLTYVRNSFGNQGSLVTAAQVAAARKRFESVPIMVSRNELDSLLASHPKVAAASLAAATPALLPIEASSVAKVTTVTTASAEEEPWEPIEGITVVGGRVPSQRPTNAPTVSTSAKAPQWYSKAIHGLPEPHAGSLRFLEDQGNWFNPFTEPGMTGPYDLRNWHTE